MSDMVMFDANADSSMLPAHLQGVGLNATQSLMAIIGDQLNRIGVKGSRFRQFIGGTEVAIWEEPYLDCIIVAVVPTLSRLFYAGKYKQKGDNDAPTCYSADNVAPPLDLPTRQSDACATCPQNIKGSKVSDDGTEVKACGYFRRVIIMLPGDPTLYRLDVKSQGLFGDDQEKLNKYSLTGFAKFLNARGVDASLLVTRLSFNTDKSTPTLLFSPNRYITPEELADVQSISDTKMLQDYLDIKFKTIDLSKETPAPEEDVPQAEAPAPQRPVATAQTPKPTPVAQTPRPAQQAAPKPVAQVPSKVRVDANVPAPKTVQAAPKPVAQAPKPVPQAPKPVQAAPVQATVTEVGTSDDLESLISELGI